MPVTLSSSVRNLVTSALAPGAAGDDPTDDDLIRALVTTATTLNSLVDSFTARGLTPARGEGTPAAPGAIADILAKILAGKDIPLDTLPDTQTRKLVGEAQALHRRFSDVTAALNDARAALAASEGRGAERAHEAFARTLHHAAREGRVPDDLPQGPLRAFAEEVAALRVGLNDARIAAEEAQKEATTAEKRLTEYAKRAANKRAEIGRTEREGIATEAEHRVRAAEQRALSAERSMEALKALKEQAVKDAKRYQLELKQMKRDRAEALAALNLAAQTLGLSPDAAPEDVIARMQERLGAPTEPARVKATPMLPPAQPEPPWSRECDWRDLQDGELALDRARYQRMLAALDDALVRDAPDPDDATRRYLVLREGDRVVWLRGDGLHADGTVHADAPAFAPRRALKDAVSPRALVIAEGVKGDPFEVRQSWLGWVDAAKLAPGIPAALQESQPASEGA